jgi:hypothetical protein
MYSYVKKTTVCTDEPAALHPGISEVNNSVEGINPYKISAEWMKAKVKH